MIAYHVGLNYTLNDKKCKRKASRFGLLGILQALQMGCVLPLLSFPVNHSDTEKSWMSVSSWMPQKVDSTCLSGYYTTMWSSRSSSLIWCACLASCVSENERVTVCSSPLVGDGGMIVESWLDGSEIKLGRKLCVGEKNGTSTFSYFRLFFYCFSVSTGSMENRIKWILMHDACSFFL